MDGAKFQQLQLKVNNMELDLLNYYCSNNRLLILNSVEVAATKFSC